ncbi:MAG: hypothetical protein GY920_16830 [Aliivibrio sp.]|nr:hypothetical protein [Aliivibrio sp.]
MNLKSRLKKLTEQAKRANAEYYFIAPKYQATDINNPKYGLLEVSGDIKPFTHIYHSDETLTSDTVRELLNLNPQDQVVIVERTFTENCMGQ